MRCPASTIALLAISLSSLTGVMGSVFLPYSAQTKTVNPAFARTTYSRDFSYGTRTKRVPISSMKGTAMAIPGYGLTEQVFVGGFANFLSIYNLVITARILLSWIPQAQGVALLQPIYQITDPYLNLFRGVIPPVFGLDLSPLAAFFLLNVLTNATAAVGAEIPQDVQKKLEKSRFGQASAHGAALLMRQASQKKKIEG